MFCATCGNSIGELAACPSCPAPPPLASSSNQKDIAHHVKSASADAWAAFRMIAVNPVGEIAAAYARLGEQRALAAGCVFGAIFAATVLLVFILTVLPLRYVPPFSGILGSLVFGCVPFCSIVLCAYGSRRIHQRGGSLAADVFVAGASLLPLSLLTAIAALLGFGNGEIVALVAIFAFCYSAATLFVGLIRLSMVPESLTAPVMSCSVLLTLLLSKLVLSFFGSVNPLGHLF